MSPLDEARAKAVALVGRVKVAKIEQEIIDICDDDDFFVITWLRCIWVGVRTGFEWGRDRYWRKS